MMARPSNFTKKVADEICEQLADGKSLHEICVGKAMPCRTTVFKWLNDFPEFADQYAHAREAQADALADEMLEVARTSSASMIEATDKRLLVDTLKWQASKLQPKKYGDQKDASVKVQGEGLSIEINL